MKKILPPNITRLMAPEDRKELGATTPEQDQEKREEIAENELQQQICDLLRRHSVLYLRPAMFKRSTLPVGWPDFTFCYWGMPFAWECKVAKGGTIKGDPRPEQIKVLNQLAENGWKVAVVRSLKQAQDLLRGVIPKV
jgi:hypothetical protein